VVVIGSPVQGASLNPLLKLAGFKGWIGLAETAPYLFNFFMGTLKTSLRAASYGLAKDGRSLGNMFAKDLSKLTIGPFFESIRTLRDTDLRARVGELRMPIMGIYGKRDRIVSPRQAQVLKAHAPNSQIAWFTDSGHFPMLDEFEHFHQTVRDFLNNG
jgi:pimeloyl-ACP methyl ester carboxylesterase